MTPQNPSQTLTFLRRGRPVALRNVPPDRTLLEVLREDLGVCAAKEGCGEGDCGACTVVLGEAVNGGLRYRAINSCIRLAHSVQGMAVWTADDIAEPGTPPARGTPGNTGDQPPPAPQLHPAQEAMVRCHGSQCGFCTPGFVMSLFAMYQNSGAAPGKPVGISREQAQVDLSGNLCRCTGYRPILEAAQQMASLPLPPACGVDAPATLAALKRIRPADPRYTPYLRPQTLPELLRLRARHPKAQVVAGCTDVGLWVTKHHRRFERVLDVTATRELQRVETYPHHIAIGAAVSLTDAYTALVQERPQLLDFSRRFAGLPVRNSGTLGGNVANGSPIGDSMPLLIALGASVVLMRWRQNKTGGGIAHRELRLEDLYTGYRTNVMRPDELLAWIKVPRPARQATATRAESQPRQADGGAEAELLRVYKISKRFDDDISAVCLAIRMELQNGVVAHLSIGVGGVAATPVRARQTEAALLGQAWNADTVMAAQAVLQAEFQPISDMRASARYRQTVLGNLLRRFWLESQGQRAINLESLATLEALA